MRWYFYVNFADVSVINCWINIIVVAFWTRVEALRLILITLLSRFSMVLEQPVGKEGDRVGRRNFTSLLDAHLQDAMDVLLLKVSNVIIIFVFSWSIIQLHDLLVHSAYHLFVLKAVSLHPAHPL